MARQHLVDVVEGKIGRCGRDDFLFAVARRVIVEGKRRRASAAGDLRVRFELARRVVGDRFHDALRRNYERLKGLPPEERFKGLTAAEIQAYLEKLLKQSDSGSLMEF